MMGEASTTKIENEKSTREHWVDFLRVVATFLVVLAHIGVWGGGPGWADAFFYTLSRIGVPLFFMLSGYLLLPKEEDTWSFLKKRASKILIPFFFWSVVYDVYSNQALAETGLTLESVFRMLVRILRGPRAPHLWYLYALIGLYLFTPILRLFIAKARKLDVWYYIILWLLAVPVFLIVQGFTPIRSGFELYYFSGYVGYFLLGLALGGLELKPKVIWLAASLFILGFVATFTVVSLNLFPDLDEAVLRTYFSLNVVAMSASAFLLLKQPRDRILPSADGLLFSISRASFGIYLIHWLVVGWVLQAGQLIGISRSTGPSLLAMPLAALVVFVISFLITHVLRMIPVLKTIVP
jgi:surface polysaccharide O-acyltransferase-like enzyme